MTKSLAPLLILVLSIAPAFGSPAHGADEHGSQPAAPAPEAHAEKQAPAKPAPESHEEPKAPQAHAELGEHDTAPVPAASAKEKAHRPATKPEKARAKETAIENDFTQDPQEISSEEIASMLRIADASSARGDFESADIAYRQILAAYATPAQDRQALIGLARMFRRKHDYTRAAAVYEKILKEFPADSILPTVYLELGRTHRALGAHRLAIGRFYSVINSTLKLPEHGADVYRQLARTAQFEIAETYFMSGDYVNAATFYSRLKLLDLAPSDRARATFKSLYSLHLSGDHERAIVGLRQFLEQNPGDENSPEARYLLSVALRRLNRNQESLAAALDLLKVEQTRTASDPKRWAYWQRKTGNQLANEFYEQGDASSALAIYIGLAALSQEPAWRLPVLYQVGLCYERLRSDDRARESYRTVVEQAKGLDASAGNAELASLAEMAAWRLKQIDWQQSIDRQVGAFFQSPPPSAPGGSESPAAKAAVPTASAPAPSAPSS